MCLLACFLDIIMQPENSINMQQISIVRMAFFIMSLIVVTTGFSNPHELYNLPMINNARKIAFEQGKLVLITFQASWCAPCQWMEQTTFADPEVKAWLQKDFIFLKIDIDHEEGYRLKEHFMVKYLPTIIIFDAYGDVEARKEETLSPNQFLKLIKKVNTENNKKIIIYPLNTDISTTEILDTSSSKDFTQDSIQDITVYYTIQVGLFMKKENADILKTQIVHNTGMPVNIHTETTAGEIYYRLTVGKFRFHNDANLYIADLQSRFDVKPFVIERKSS